MSTTAPTGTVPLAEPGDGITIVPIHDNPEATRIVFEDLGREYAERYPGSDHNEIAAHPIDEFLPPEGAFLGLYEDGRLLAAGALRLDENGLPEVKRMWTHSAARRRGLAGRILRALEAVAAERGHSRIVLTTGPNQPEAVRLYTSGGYEGGFVEPTDAEPMPHYRFSKALPPRA
ncbi:GNAT family N-acetyltransferase [Pseudoclavibacter chungangensis]|uniref:GNAT family N-acetyltransferase n=1 Tax=Pseudoclavibacter chungangensis TaxID=587635 RepID=A0A7J5C474_9MICO|nr:GNAT family N-acetyltransferase [Pseudoclavibacter chungangensis]KAB1662579.1 GNAT family N-acetyltransferase [Pseudoclavibacter chungangensis]NYJ68626.1 GNAT superfamily N-acetyltransferase [Pseudoclavibacter chungangensis]